MSSTQLERSTCALLRSGGYKLTPQRRAVLRVLCDSECHVTPAQLHAAVQRERDDVGLVTVYRTLQLLSSLDAVCEISMDGRQPTYLLRRPREHHHHLVCSGCGRVVDFTSEDIERLAQRLADETGFNIEGHILEMRGRCPACQSSAPSRSQGQGRATNR